jgi:exosortase N
MSADQKLYIKLLAGYTLLFGALFHQGYLQGDATFWMGVGLIPFVLLNTPAGRRSLELTPLIVLLLVICLLRPELSFRYFLLIASVIFVTQSISGKATVLLSCVLFIISPLFRYVSEVFTFPIRLKLSNWSGVLLRAADIPVKISGNIIQVEGADFSVAPACVGLQMTGFSLLAAIFLIIHVQMKSKKALQWYWKILVLLIAFGMNIFSNLIRIITLVLFDIKPENPMHDWIGIACLVLYVWLPVSLLVQHLDRRFSKPLTEDRRAEWKPGRALVWGHLMLLVLCGYFTLQKRTPPLTASKNMPENPYDYKMSVLESGVTCFKSPETLVYVKAIPGFYSTEHNPTLCWIGSGYELTSVKEQIIDGKVIYTGTLRKGLDELQTAWWFSNKQHVTISQFDWRWRAMCGEGDFRLVNVTSNNESDLKSSVSRWLMLI